MARRIVEALCIDLPFQRDLGDVERDLEGLLRDGLLQLEDPTPRRRTLQRPGGADAPPKPKTPAPEPTDEPSWMEVRVVDEIGQPVDGLPMRFEADDTTEPTTDGAGTVRVDPVRAAVGHATIVDPELRERMRARWDEIREAPWLEEEVDHTYCPVRVETDFRATLLQETPHTLVLQPWCIRLRLVGLYFDTNKAFLLPTARPAMRELPKIYAVHPESDWLVIGHTDTSGEPYINDPLSLERAESVVAFLTDDVEAWYAWYGFDKPEEKRWGWREDRAMIGALPDFGERPPAETEVVWFQRTRGLEVDGWAGPNTRRALIAEYMALDGTTLPSSATLTRHGCGESFPTGAADDQEDRRVEFFLFDRELGVQPLPPGVVSPPDSPQYPEWVRRARYTQDIFAGHETGPTLRLCDAAQNPLPHAVARFVGTDRRVVADGGGWVRLDKTVVNQERCEIEWTRPGDEQEEPWPFRRDVYLELGADEGAADRRRLHNLGYDELDTELDAVRGFELDFRGGHRVTGEMSAIAHELRHFHDGGPRRSAVAFSQDGEVADADLKDPSKVGTMAPLPTTHRVRLEIERETDYHEDTLAHAQLHYTWTRDDHDAPPLRGHGDDEDGFALADFDGVADGMWTVMVEETLDGGIIGRGIIETEIAPPNSGTIVKLQVPLAKTPHKATFDEIFKQTKYEFDDIVHDGPHKLLMVDEDDVLTCEIASSGTFSQVEFKMVDGSVATVAPMTPSADTTILTFKGGKVGRTDLRVVETATSRVLSTLHIVVGEPQQRLVGGRSVRDPRWQGSFPKIDWSAVGNKINEIFERVGLTVQFKSFAPMDIEFDINQDGRLDIDSIIDEQCAFHEHSKEMRRIDDEGKSNQVGWMIYAVDRGKAVLGLGIMGAVLTIPDTAAFVFPDIIARVLSEHKGAHISNGEVAAHELGHAFGMAHVVDADNLMHYGEAIVETGDRLRVYQWHRANSNIPIPTKDYGKYELPKC